jgi:hypothetical protein
MKRFFQASTVLLISLVIQGCVTTEYAYFRGPSITENYPAGMSNWQTLPPPHTTIYHAGTSTGGGVERYDYGPRHHHDDYRPQKTVVHERVETRTTTVIRRDGNGGRGGYNHHR